MNKKIFRLLLAQLLLLLALTLSGCMASAPVEDLYVLPRLPEEYEDLNAQLAAIRANGAEQTSPQGGTNLQSVQLVDLDGDGDEEAVAFFRDNSEERPLKIFIFRAVEDSYEQAAIIDGSGTAIRSIRYEDMTGDGVKEILVCWRVSAEVQALGVYALEDMEPMPLMSTAYARYEVEDLDDDDMKELVVIRNDEGETGVSLADYYDWDGGSLLLRSSARLSVAVAELQWTQTGRLEDGETAVFVTGRETGVEETSRAITDILVYREPDLTNIVLDSDTGVSTEIYRFINDLQPADIDGDGVMEVPMPAQLPVVSAEDGPYWKIYWRSFDANGQATRRAITYHNIQDSWYLMIPESWDGHFTVQQNNGSTTERATTFYSVGGVGVKEELFTIYTLTGPKRKAQAMQGGRVVLRSKQGTEFAVRFAPAYSDWRYAIDQKEFIKRFNTIVAQWGGEG